MKEYRNFIDGKWVSSRTGKTFENRNPANWEEVVGIFPASDSRDVDDAVSSAKAAFPSWRLVPPPKRADILLKTRDILIRRKEEISQLMTREMGKVLVETRGDTQEGIDTALYSAGEGRRLFGQTTTSELRDKFAMSIRLSVGVCGLITPWNFPMAIPTWKVFPALICGNTVVIKPASDTPLTATLLVEVLSEAGVPEGVVNIVHGGGGSVGTAIVEHKDVSLISFTGSSDVGRDIGGRCGRSLKKVSLELGGKNGQIVMDDADLYSAVEGALWGAFGTTGQRCTATSRLIVHEKVLKEFTAMFIERTRKLKVGDGLLPDVQVGPLVNKGQRDTVDKYVKIGISEGAKLLTGGKVCEEGDLKKGFFYEPTVFGDVHRKMRIAQEEIFGPVIGIIPAKDFDDAVSILNDSDYGLSSSIYTNDITRAQRAIRDLEAGITYINGPTIGAEVHLPFGGVKATGNGHREASVTVLDIFSEWKSVYIDFSGKLQRAQIDT
ncbi:MAG: aldehyde dehydrogenase family protein [Candidatus Eisenbacteria bacterium]|nr:aldehyde dehydrogenase family protein [Candidatus Eisenbacteria bacterium]